MKVYTVSIGEYSDARIVAVFGRREDAEAISGGYVEEFEMDDPTWMNRRGMKAVAVSSLPRSIEVANAYTTDIDVDQVDPNVSVWPHDRTLHTVVIARDIAHAIKIAADRFREHIATVGWGKQSPGGEALAGDQP